MTVEAVDLDDVEQEPHADLFESEPKTIQLSLSAGEEIAAHRHPDRQIVFHVLEGSLVVTIGEGAYEVSAGDVLRFDGDRDVSPRAVEDATALLVMANRQD